MAPADARCRRKAKKFVASKLSHAALLAVRTQGLSTKLQRRRQGPLDESTLAGGCEPANATAISTTSRRRGGGGGGRRRIARNGENEDEARGCSFRVTEMQEKPLPQPSTISRRTATTVTANTARPQPHVSSGGIKRKPKSYLEKLQSRLAGGQFRMLNEKLYTCSGQEAFKIFQQDPFAFECYHAGYQEQMSRWPSQPLEFIIRWLKKKSTSLIVADFGCGDAKLAKSVTNKVFSMDLVASDESVIACNMAQTPLQTQSVDVAVFCLSLMGTDYSSFLVESHRVLRPRGSLLIAEVRSRFDPNNGGADPLAFINALKTLGFSLVSKDFSNKLFVTFEFLKEDRKGTKECEWPKLKPCIYKRR